MLAIFTLLLVVTLSLLVNRVASVALTFTGMSRDSARFQARSAFTGAGFTTLESEDIVNHPVRRRIIMLLMLLGNAGFVTIIATLLGSFVGVQEDRPFPLEGVTLVLTDESGHVMPDIRATFEAADAPSVAPPFLDRIFGSSRLGRILGRVTLLVIGLAMLWSVAQSKWVDRRLHTLITWALKTFTRLDIRDFHGLLHFAEGYTVEEIRIEEGHWAVGKTLGQARIGDEGIQVLGIQRADGDYLGSPTGESFFRAGDRLILYACYSALESFRNRRHGDEGQAEHQRRVMEHLGELAQQTTEDRGAKRETELAKQEGP